MRKLGPGEPIFFLLGCPWYAIGGYGFFTHFTRLRLEMVWESFREKDGAHLSELPGNAPGAVGVERVEPVAAGQGAVPGHTGGAVRGLSESSPRLACAVLRKRQRMGEDPAFRSSCRGRNHRLAEVGRVRHLARLRARPVRVGGTCAGARHGSRLTIERCRRYVRRTSPPPGMPTKPRAGLSFDLRLHPLNPPHPTLQQMPVRVVQLRVRRNHDHGAVAPAGEEHAVGVSPELHGVPDAGTARPSRANPRLQSDG